MALTRKNNPTSQLLNAFEIGAVYDSQPNPYLSGKIDGIDIFMTIHSVWDSPFAVLLQILLIGYYNSVQVCYYKSGWQFITNPVSYFITYPVDFNDKSCCHYISGWFVINFITNISGWCYKSCCLLQISVIQHLPSQIAFH